MTSPADGTLWQVLPAISAIIPRRSPFLVNAGDWVKYQPVSRKEYDKIRKDVERGTYKLGDLCKKGGEIVWELSLRIREYRPPCRTKGRFGYQQFGVSPAGPMDTQSFYLANILAGNPRGESALEITFMGPSLKFEKDNTIACYRSECLSCGRRKSHSHVSGGAGP